MTRHPRIRRRTALALSVSVAAAGALAVALPAVASAGQPSGSAPRFNCHHDGRAACENKRELLADSGYDVSPLYRAQYGTDAGGYYFFYER